MAWNTGLAINTPAYNFAIEQAQSICVVAGPGTGKSFGLRRRVARFLEEGVSPRRILAVTFTRTAAQDLCKEIQEIEVIGADKVVAKTLHSFCFQLLQKNDIIKQTGRFPRPLIEHEQKPMLYDLYGDYGGLREREKRLRAFEAAWARLQSEDPGYPKGDIDRQFGKEVQQWLIQHNAMLFGEMIIEAYHYLRDNPQCQERHMFDHVLVDEYQDLNKAEQAVVELLSTECNLAVIGDDDQSIYSFKYAHPDGIRDFPQNHEHCSQIAFDTCRRCPKQVVAMASRLICNNEDRTLGNLKPIDDNQNGNVRIIQWRDLDNEINGISNVIKKNIEKKNVRPEDVLVLAPRRKIGYRLRDSLVNEGISAKSYFREDALRNDDQRYNFSLLNLIANPNDLVALRYLLGFGNQTFRATSYKYITDYAKHNHITIDQTFEKLHNDEIKISRTTSILQRYTLIRQEVNNIRAILNNDRGSLLNLFAPDNLDNAELRSILQLAIDEISCQEIVSLDGWLNKVFSFALEKISFPENVEAKDHVRIMSLHASKGLSAKFVVVMSCIDDLLPRTDPECEISIEEQIEEQRRLFYVAITRCKSSQIDYPGTLIISSFAGLPGNEALGLGIPARANDWRYTNATRFIREFEDTAPKTIRP